MTIYTMGFTQKCAEQFFSLIEKSGAELLIDIRLNNQSQLAGFTKGKDLKYFLMKICRCEYVHDVMCAPTKEILQDYKKNVISWDEYEVLYNGLIDKRNIKSIFEKKYSKYSKVILLCSEPTPENCHRRLLAEYLNKELGYKIIHI